MGHRLVAQPNGRYAIFSTVVDNIIVYDCTEDDLVDYYSECEREKARRMVTDWIHDDRGHNPVRTLDEILETIGDCHGEEEAEKQRRRLTGEGDADFEFQETRYQIARLLTEREETVAVVETGAGGRISMALTMAPHASKFFKEGRVAYSHDSKPGSPSVYALCGSVSDEAATEMATQAQWAFGEHGATWGLAETSITGPDGGTEEKPVGLVIVAVAKPRRAGALVPEDVLLERKVIEGSRRMVQEGAAEFALECLLTAIKENKP